MRRRMQAWMLAALGLALPLTAAAVPASTVYTGELWAENGLPYQGSVDVSVAVFDAASGGSQVWNADFGGMAIANGLLEVDLGNAALVQALVAHDALWLEFTIDSETLSPRQALRSVPYAQVAGTAQSLQGYVPSDFAPASGALQAPQLPTNGLGNVSNGALTNAFADVQWASQDAGAPIPDAPEGAGQATVSTSETGEAYLTDFRVSVDLILNANSTLNVRLFAPPGAGMDPIMLVSGGSYPFGTYSWTFDPTTTPVLAELIGKKVAGTWTLEVTDTDDNLPNGSAAGTIVGFDIFYDVVRSDDVYAGGDLRVEGAVQAMGGIIYPATWKVFYGIGIGVAGQPLPNRDIQFQKHRTDTALRIQWNDATRCTTGGQSCRAQIRVDGKLCTSPGPMQIDWYMDPVSVNHHRVATITTYCRQAGGAPIAAGPHTIDILYVGAASGAPGEFYFGWSNSQGSLTVEEVF